jgi:AcrR family transcriptional regulator
MVEKVVTRDGAPAPLTVDVIVRAATGIVDRDGLSALTMRRLGRELDVQAMSIYHHVPNKSVLLDRLVEHLLAPAEGVASADSPTELLEAHCRGLRAALHAHPNLAPLVAARLPPAAGDSDATTIAARLVDAGFDREAARWIVDAFVGFAVGHSVVGFAAERKRDSGDDAAFDTGLRFLLVGLRDELGA